MRGFTYAAEFERGDKKGIVVSFPDVPEAITQGDDMADAREQAEEALGLALLTYPDRGLPLPKARAKGKGLTLVAVAPGVAAKLAVLEAFSGPPRGRQQHLIVWPMFVLGCLAGGAAWWWLRGQLHALGYTTA